MLLFVCVFECVCGVMVQKQPVWPMLLKPAENRRGGAQVCRAVRAGPAASLQINPDDRWWDQPSQAAILLVNKDLCVLVPSRDSETGDGLHRSLCYN